MEELMKQELRQAETAGNRALNSLYAVRDTLDSAKKWGWLDVFGGGFLTDYVKHSKIESAKTQIAQAKYDLHIFEKELKDIYMSADFRMEIGSFLSFADFFFDNPVTDYMVQTKIQETLEEINDAILLVEELLGKRRGQSL